MQDADAIFSANSVLGPSQRYVEAALAQGGNLPTKSEDLFERFCSAHGIKCDRIATASTRTADYRFYPASQEVIVEVKQLEPNAEDHAHEREILKTGGGGRSYPVGKRLRQEISDSNQQIRALAKDRCPSLLVVYNNIPFGTVHTDPMMVLIAMYGQIEAIIAVPTNLEESPYLTETRFGGNRGVTEGQNTSLSAVCVLHETGETAEPGLTFYHNAFATKKFMPDWLRASGVRHYGIANAGVHRFENWIEL